MSRRGQSRRGGSHAPDKTQSKSLTDLCDDEDEFEEEDEDEGGDSDVEEEESDGSESGSESEDEESDAASVSAGSEAGGPKRCQKPLETQVSFQIQAFFENQKTVRGTFERFLCSSDSVVIQGIDDDAVFHTKSFGRITLVICTKNKHLAQRWIKSTTAKMIQDLKMTVTYRYKHQHLPNKPKKHGSTEGYPSSGNSLVDRSGENEPCRKVSEKSDNENLYLSKKSDKREPCEEDETSFSDLKSAKTETLLQESLEKTNPVSVPTKVFVMIYQIFDDTQELFSYLNTVVKNEASFELLVDSLIRENSSTKCNLRAPSKAAAKKIIKALNNFKCPTGGKIKASITEITDVAIPKVKETKLEQNKIKALVNIEKEMSDTMEKHDKRFTLLEEALRNVEAEMDNFISEESYGEQITLREKLTEARLQQEEFLVQCDKVTDSVKELNPYENSETDLRNLVAKITVECSRLEQALPMYARRKDIVKTVQTNQVSVILGETGSGKSTQLVQYLFEAGLGGSKTIVCTQPRKVAAISLAERVAFEMNRKDLVGYKTGVRSKVDKTNKILFSTDHSLLNECLVDPHLNQYALIIIDEAHERSIYTDILLGMIKTCLAHRPDLRVVITSATIDPSVFIQYFNTKPEMRVSGRMFPVDVFYDNDEDNLEFENFTTKAVKKAVEIHQNEQGPGDILVFLTSVVETMQCCEEFLRQMKGKPENFKCLPLHGQLPQEEQKKVFQQLDEGIRKIIFSTNCAETSVTIDGVKFIVDTGLSKEMRFDPKRNMNLLGTHIISKSSADQRKGRAGRTSSGKCYRLFSEASYKAMASITEPEILRVNLGQVVLKMAELGVDIEQYEFVQAPSPDALQCALQMLRELRALDETQITDIGKFLAKLPFDPRQGYFIYRGWQENLLYDTVVIASLMNNGSNIFYRGLTETEAQKSACSQNEFGSQWGDIFTWLEVFKTWLSVERKEQTNWCREKAINYKVLKLTFQSMSDTMAIMKRDLNIEVPRNFSSDEAAILKLRKLLFQANVNSTCHFLGHARAGYFAVGAERQVHLHPSSYLASEQAQPEWIIYTELTKTSREFIKGITIVEEAWVMDAIQKHQLHMSLEEASHRKIESVYKESFGPSVFKALVGPRYSNIRTLEEDLSNAGMETVVVETDRDTGIVEIFSSSPMVETLAENFRERSQSVIDTLKKGQHEISVTKNPGEDCGCRVVVGSGGEVMTLLMPWESNTILIKNVPHDASIDMVKAKFEAFGTVQTITRFKPSGLWGLVKYSSAREAEAAVSSTESDEEMTAVLSRDRQFEFEARLSWCRRPVKGNGIAFIKCPPVEKENLIGAMLDIRGRECRICENKTDGDLVCKNFGDARESEIMDNILEHLNHKTSQNIRVTIVREKADMPTEREYKLYHDILSKALEVHVPCSDFKIDLFRIKSEHVCFQKGFIRFRKTAAALDACEKLKNSLSILGHSVELIPKLKSTIHVPKEVMDVCGAQVNVIVKTLNESGIETQVKKTNKQDTMILLSCSQQIDIVKGRETLMKVIRGKNVVFNENEKYEHLSGKHGQDCIESLKKRLEVAILLDPRFETVHIYGEPADVEIAELYIGKFLKDIPEMRYEEVFLRGSNQPTGLLKSLMKRYGSLIEGLISETGLEKVELDFKKHKLSLAGSTEAIEKCHLIIEEVKKGLVHKENSKVPSELPECVVCLSPVDSVQESRRLEVCGHCYCVECLRMQVVVLVEEKSFPLCCANCQMDMVWKDLEYFLRNNWISREKLAQRTLSSCVERHRGRYSFCPTVDCPVAYTVTQEAFEFVCPACGASTCTSCHKVAHAGIPCGAVEGTKMADETFELWKQKDKENRKECPGCSAPVEKIDGCNKMHCRCNTVFCWLCLKIAESENKCYEHLNLVHGGCFDVPN